MFSHLTGITRRRFLARSATVAGAAALGGISREMHAARSPGDITGAGSLKRHAADARLLFGFAVDVGQLRNPVYRQLVEDQCTIIAAENAMKWGQLAPTPSSYNFDAADELIAFSDRTHIKVRGHALCWHGQLPDWFASTATPGNARDMLINHIKTVAGRYAGRMHSWDVVNEAIEPSDNRPDGLRNSIWLKLLGTDYIETAFHAARDADPTALLCYNDYDLELDTIAGPPRRAALLVMLRRLKQRNVPIDAVGIQSHLRAGDHYGQGLLQFMDACREMDLQVFLSEMEVNDRFLPANTDERDRAVAETYTEYLNTALKARNVTAVLTWGVSDANTWLSWVGENRADGKPLRPLLFDDKFQPTRAFTAVRDAFSRRQQHYAGVRSPEQTQSGPNRPVPKL